MAGNLKDLSVHRFSRATEELATALLDQLDHYREVIYEHVYTHYKEAA